MSERTTDPDEVTPVKLFKSESRKQRMFEYAMLRTPQFTREGRELLLILSEVISDEQPTPQVSGQIETDMIMCEWLVDGWNVELWVERNSDDYWDNEFIYTIADNENTRDTCSAPDEFEWYTREDAVACLRPRLNRLAAFVDEEHRIIR